MLSTIVSGIQVLLEMWVPVQFLSYLLILYFNISLSMEEFLFYEDSILSAYLRNDYTGLTCSKDFTLKLTLSLQLVKRELGRIKLDTLETAGC